MSVALYMDVDVPRPITRGLRRHGVDVLTAQEDGTTRWEDAELLDRVAELNSRGIDCRPRKWRLRKEIRKIKDGFRALEPILVRIFGL